MISATTAERRKIFSHVYSNCILWISAQTNFSWRWETAMKTCRLPLPRLTHTFSPSSRCQAGSFPYMRGTRVLDSAAELLNVPAPILPPIWRRRCLLFAQVHREGSRTWLLVVICVTACYYLLETSPKTGSSAIPDKPFYSWWAALPIFWYKVSKR